MATEGEEVEYESDPEDAPLSSMRRREASDDEDGDRSDGGGKLARRDPRLGIGSDGESDTQGGAHVYEDDEEFGAEEDVEEFEAEEEVGKISMDLQEKVELLPEEFDPKEISGPVDSGPNGVLAGGDGKNREIVLGRNVHKMCFTISEPEADDKVTGEREAYMASVLARWHGRFFCFSMNRSTSCWLWLLIVFVCNQQSKILVVESTIKYEGH